MKIVIVGAGISGCATYHFLNKHLPQPECHQYTIYESHATSADAPVRLGSGGWLGIGPNGLKVLKCLDEQIWLDVLRGGYSYAEFQLKKSDGQTLWQSAATGEKRMSSVVLSRDLFWRRLMERIPSHVIVNKRVSRVLPNPKGRHIVEFADGGDSIEADLVIGADGLKSVVKRSIFADQGADPYPPHYEGMVGTGGFMPASKAIQTTLIPGSLTIVFGQNTSFGYVYPKRFESDPDETAAKPTSDHMISWWSIYATPECPNPKTIDTEDATQHVRERHGSWQDPVVQQVIQRARVETIYPVQTTPELPTWERDGVILLGDAAHTLPPVLGQGSSQALEDAEALSLFLSHYLHKVYRGNDIPTEREAIRVAAKQYMDLRYPRVRAILDTAKRMQQNNWTSGLASQEDRVGSVEKYDIAEEIGKVLSAEIHH